MHREIIYLPEGMYEALETAYKNYLKEQYPFDDRQFPFANEAILKEGRPNFVYKGHVFIQAGPITAGDKEQ